MAKKKKSTESGKTIKVVKKTSQLKDWREFVYSTDIFDQYSCDVIIIAESTKLVWSSVENFIDKAKEMDSVKPITHSDIMNLFENFNLNCNSVSVALLKLALDDLKQELSRDATLSTRSLAMLIKLQILIAREQYLQNREKTLYLKNARLQEANDFVKQLKKSQSKKVDKKKTKKSKVKEKKEKKEKKKDSKKSKQTLEELYEQMNKSHLTGKVTAECKPIDKETESCEADINAHTYFAICKMYNPDLLLELEAIGVEVSAVIEITCNDSLEEENQEIDTKNEDFVRFVDMNHFWETWQVSNFRLSSVLPPNTCYIKYVAPDPESDQIYQHIECLLLNITDFKRQYKMYIDNVRFVNVVEQDKIVLLKTMKTYNKKIEQTPNECITCSFLLNCLMEEVCTRIDGAVCPTRTKKVNVVKVHAGPQKQMQTLLKRYSCNKKNMVNTVQVQSDQDKIKTKKLTYGNIIDYMCGHLKLDNYVLNFMMNYLELIPPIKLFRMIDKSDAAKVALYNYRFAKWSEDLALANPQELRQIVCSYLFSKMKIEKRLDHNNAAVKSIESLLLGDLKPYNKNKYHFKVYLSKCKAPDNIFAPLLSFSDPCIALPYDCECEKKGTTHYNMAETLDTSAMLQMINTAYNDFENFEYKYFSPNDMFLIRFYRDIKKDGFNIFTFNNELRTFVCFRDFCSYILSANVNWFIEQEKKYVQEIKEKEELKKLEEIEQMKKKIICEENFIEKGSIKDQLLNKETESKVKKDKKGKKGKKDKKSKKSKSDTSKKQKSKDKKSKTSKKNKDIIKKKSKQSMKQIQDVSTDIKIERIDLSVPKTLPVIDPKKTYPFEGYNISTNFVYSRTETCKLNSNDGISVVVETQEWPETISYSFNISSNDSSLVFHCKKNDVLLCEEPFMFHVNAANGIVMAFENNLVVDKTANANLDSTKHIVTDTLNKKINVAPKVGLQQLQLATKLTNKKSERSKPLENLILALKNKMPVFKIISSALHKYQYVKRIKSYLEIPIGKVVKRISFKPKLFIRVSKRRQIKESKCIPYTNLVNQRLTEMAFKWKATLPTGLCLQTVQAVVPYPLYIKQNYLINRSDINILEEETQRCFLRNGTVMKFLKDGSIITLVPDKTFTYYQYGCFSSNKQKNKILQHKTPKFTKKSRIVIPLHACINNLTKLERRIRKICKKYQKHLIDISDNYRFESTRKECRQVNKMYKMSKKLFRENSSVIPLLNYSVITSTGTELKVKNNVVFEHPKKYQEMIYYNYLTNEVVLHREDGTSWLLNKNGESITQFPDGTRITTWYTIIDENFLLEESVSESLISERTSSAESATNRYCQVNSDDLIMNTDNREQENMYYESTESVHPEYEDIDDSFVVLGINYKFEHPNYATVIYYCTDDRADVCMPDDIKVTAYKEGTYKVNLLCNDTINVNRCSIEYNAGSCLECKFKAKCILNIAPFLLPAKPIAMNDWKREKKEIFLTVTDSSNMLFQVDFYGNTKKRSGKFDKTCCDRHQRIVTERLFALKRDLSGEEFYRDPIPYRFIHAMHNLKDMLELQSQSYMYGFKNPLLKRIVQPLRKTYTEHLMMLYDEPMLAITNQFDNIDKLCKWCKFDINMLILQRKPLFLFQRLISNLPVSEVISLIQADIYNYTAGIDNKISKNLVTEIYESVTKICPVIEKYKSKLQGTYETELLKYKQIIKHKKTPKYFETLKGFMFTLVNECAERAMLLSTNKPSVLDTSQHSLPLQIKSETPPVETQVEVNELTVSEWNRAYTGEEFIPQDTVIRLKSDSPVHEIILTRTGIKIISQTATENIPFLLYADNESEMECLEETSVKSLPNIEEITDQQNENIPTQLKGESSDVRKNKDSLHQSKPSTRSFLTNDAINLDEDNVKTDKYHRESVDLKENEKCMRSACICPPPSAASTVNDRCNYVHCTCSNTCIKKTKCLLRSERDVTIAAWNVVSHLEANPELFQNVQGRIGVVLRSILSEMELKQKYIENLIRAIKWMMEHKKLNAEQMTKEHALNILNEIRNRLHEFQDSKNADQYTQDDLLQIADSIHTLMFQIMNGLSKSDIILNIRCLLLGTYLPASKIKLVLDYVTAKVSNTQSLPILPGNKTIDVLINKKHKNVLSKLLLALDETADKHCTFCKDTSDKSTSVNMPDEVNKRKIVKKRPKQTKKKVMKGQCCEKKTCFIKVKRKVSSEIPVVKRYFQKFSNSFDAGRSYSIESFHETESNQRKLNKTDDKMFTRTRLKSPVLQNAEYEFIKQISLQNRMARLSSDENKLT